MPLIRARWWRFLSSRFLYTGWFRRAYVYLVSEMIFSIKKLVIKFYCILCDKTAKIVRKTSGTP